MNRTLFAGELALMLLLASCKGENPAEKYGDTIIKSYKNAHQIGNKATLQNLQDAVRSFYAANGRYPNDLKELSEFSGIELGDSKYEYDPSSGKITQKQ